jgi:hypothetical protein
MKIHNRNPIKINSKLRLVIDEAQFQIFNLKFRKHELRKFSKSMGKRWGVLPD